MLDSTNTPERKAAWRAVGTFLAITFALTMKKKDAATKIKRWIVFIIVTLMAIDLGVVGAKGQWLSAFLILTIALLIMLVTIFSNRLVVQIPTEFQVLALLFVFHYGKFSSFLWIPSLALACRNPCSMTRPA